MSDSLTVSRLFELLGGGVASTLPQCAGVQFRLGDQYSFGTPQPVVDFVITMMGDGERPTGFRMANRPMSFPVTIITAPSGDTPAARAADRLRLSAAREALFQAINVSQFELVWTPEGNPDQKTVFDCWRAKASTVDFNYKHEKGLVMVVTIEFDAYPWGRSDKVSTIAFDSPILTAANTPVYTLNDSEGGTFGATVTGSNSGPTTSSPYNTPFTTVTIGGGDTLIYDTAQAAHGSLSLFPIYGAATNPCYVTWSSPYAGSPTQWFRMYLYLTANPNTAALVIAEALTAASTSAGKLKLNTNGTLSMDAGAGSNVITTANALPLNQWVRIEGYVTGDAAIGQVGMSVYAAMDSGTALEVIDSAAALNTIDAPASWRFGLVSGGNAFYNYHLDDVAISASGPIGAYQVFGAGGSYVSTVDIDRFDSVSSTTQPLWFQRTATTAYGSYSARWYRDLTDKISPLLYTRNLYDAGQSSGFESTSEGYIAGSQTAVARTTAQAHLGVGSLSITASGTPAATASVESGPVVTCTQGDRLTVSAWVRSAVTARTVTLNLTTYTGANVAVGTVAVASASDSSGAWTLLTGSVQIPYSGAQVGYARAQVSVASPAANEVHYTDDVSWTRGAWADIRGRDKLAFWLGLGVDPNTYRLWHKGNAHFSVTLTDINGRSKTFGFQAQVRASNNQSWPFWQQLSCAIPTSRTFRYDRVVSYSMKVWTDSLADGNLHLKAGAYLSGLRASPTAGVKRPASDRGGDYTLYGIDGTAPTPLSLHCQLGFSSYVATTRRFNLDGNAGSPLSYTAPAENPNWLTGDAANFDTNGGIGSWTGSDGLATNAVPTNSATVALSGLNSMRVAPTAGGSNAVIASVSAAAIAAQGVPCVPGDRITLRANVRAGTTTRSIIVGAQFFTSGGASISRVDLGGVTDSNAAWTLISGRVTAPATAAYARMIITVTTPAGGEFHYFDDLYISWGLQALVMCMGAGGSGGSIKPTSTAGGGGGGGEIAWETNLDLTPLGTHAYTIGKGGAPLLTGSTGLDGGISFFTGATVTVTADGGSAGQNRITTDFSNGTGGAGGSGSPNSHHFNGGAGATGNQSSKLGGGGGGGAGDGGVGGAGSAPNGGNGGAAGALSQPGGRGGDGWNGSTGGGGHIGYPTGAGGGGAAAYSQTQFGAQGTDGKVTMIMTTYSTQAAFPTLLVHKPAPESTTRCRTVVPIGGGLDSPDGREYEIGDVDGFTARYHGTYTVWAVNFSWNGSTARNISATIRQYEASGGAVSSYTLTQSITPANVLNGMVNLGEINLPVKDMAPDNVDSYFTAALLSGNSADRFLDLILVDSSGQTFLLNIPGGGYTDYWVDAPGLGSDIGRVLGSMQDRQQAVSCLTNTDITGGPLILDPGINQFTIYSPQGMPGLEGEYIPHWWLERLA